ncbi:tRNA (guanosine(46)-N7)-methyltransferase TrmB [Fastidiosibacter lacustris]|uniref:tRNA (guanosine(46)-N7)-methyltransferase TrmB n=1 Tax=Fastidiosibacter lacustris TaxID=2056695 RepID=UPI000E34EAF7|nr:tRNA (guanosine(46)-N7)-methyltransferase TrmB [Fastidiosibacter lacustris]
MTDNTPIKHMRTIKSFVKRAGRTTTRQQYALNEYATSYKINFCDLVTDFNQYYATSQALVLEIGFGMGDSLVKMAKEIPTTNFLGIEVHEPGVGNILDHIHSNNLSNLRIMQHDAVEVLHKMIADNSLTGVQIFFPDPWHKKRHHKRRLVNADFIKLLVRKLKTDGFIHFATDWQQYADEVLELFTKDNELKNDHNGFATRPNSRPITKFEKRGQALKHNVWDIVVHKK